MVAVGWSAYLKALLASPLLGRRQLPSKYTSAPLQWHPETNRHVNPRLIETNRDASRGKGGGLEGASLYASR